MSTLHTVNKSPFEKSSLQSCLRVAAAGGAVLLIEDGVYAAVRGTELENVVREAATRLELYVLTPDMAARGLSQRSLIEGVATVDYNGFVDLVVAHDNVQSWL